MRVDENVYKQMPEHLKRLFVKLPNPGSDEVVQGFPQTTSNGQERNRKIRLDKTQYRFGGDYETQEYSDSGSAARYFKECPFTEEDLKPFYYTAKASKAERNMGCEGLDDGRRGMNFGGEFDGSGNPINIGMHKNSHPTVKPLALMRYLCRLITPPGGTVLDPFCGSGTTIMAARQEGFKATGIEKEAHYCEIARCRVRAVEAGQMTIFNV